MCVLPKSGVGRTDHNIRVKLSAHAVAPITTKDGWTLQPFQVNSRERDAPARYVINRVRWRTVPDDRRSGELEHFNTGYYAEAATAQRFHPIIFHHERCCWVELRWNRTQEYFEAARPAGDDLNCNILLTEARPIEGQGRIDGEPEEEALSEPLSPELQHRTPARSDTSHTSERAPTPSIAEEPEHIYVQEEEPGVEEIIQQTATLHIPDPIRMATQTLVEEPTPLVIDERTGHVVDMNPADLQAARRAMGPDEPDQPGGFDFDYNEPPPQAFEHINRGDGI